MKDRNLTTSEAAMALGVSRRRVQQLIAKKILPASWFGQQLVIREADLGKARKRRTTPGPISRKNTNGA
jgi:excisionase family DNA binding protein